MNIGILIRKGRKQKSWNQTELAKKMGVHQTHVSQWENGEKRIYGDDLIKIARLLDIVEEIFPEYQEVEKESDTRRFVRERLYKMEEDLSEQIRLLEQRIHERDKLKLEKNPIFIFSNEEQNVSLIKEIIGTFSPSIEIVTEKLDKAHMILKKSNDLISLVVVDFSADFEQNILKVGKIVCKKQIPCVLVIEKVTSKVLKKFIPGTFSVVKKPLNKNDLSKIISQMNLHWRSSTNA